MPSPYHKPEPYIVETKIEGTNLIQVIRVVDYEEVNGDRRVRAAELIEVYEEGKKDAKVRYR